MANASSSSASTTTTPTPSSAWSRLVQLTRTASEGSRSKANESSSQLNHVAASGTHTLSSVPPAKKRRLAESSPARSVTKYLAPLSPEPNDLRNMSPGKSTKQISCPPISNHDCITACPCRVEDVDCVAPQQQEENIKHCTSQTSRPLPTTVSDHNQHVTPRRPGGGPRHSLSQRVLDTSPRARESETKDTTVTHFGEQPASEYAVDETETAEELHPSVPSNSDSRGDDAIVATIVSEKGQSATVRSLFTMASGLQEGDQNSVNKTPVSKRHAPSPASMDESIQLATPTSSPTAKHDTGKNDANVDATKPHKPAPAPKTKRRLTLHGGSYERQTSQKRRKTAPKRKDGVQTTLSLAIGSSAGMRECKLCDTVYNPFHPEDVKVHAKRHAIAVKSKRSSEETADLTASSLVD